MQRKGDHLNGPNNGNIAREHAALLYRCRVRVANVLTIHFAIRGIFLQAIHEAQTRCDRTRAAPFRLEMMTMLKYHGLVNLRSVKAAG